ncbi:MULTISPECIES: polyprenyl diphosphate synthase [Legionella]|uniref:Ditrans,polycis-undecaprenyl-diphosphate synthase ((2E,6E)-farnesyl-diphosphate specific) n=1 Tax=Legionella septentrionalis TaxID=2498109 RepID=A0A3S0X464_9GAMM|nr:MULTISPECIES: polyprenyl diphosphate synthase [Legionella]MCP0913177.1 polyprenyl diphosphate synthase [Legionella sp. 27cVA30]RUQ88060.1 di-trans,poly-cis-decaprenylcistransferase [Legionella septentrionalis]RUR02439.1 di-trans,poly-cis-decaprenylcistransferase [Legionella septentrionalis]RUR09296.1 di-trans,poly-cis-decaprenylcistransferase [Legionella septentrionalis]RUR17097.1 di-trans,poly-cis-decaprenylcistransferase [Legionella septentrionalis]
MNQKLPEHVAIVMDGNGRWAENRGLPRAEGHRAGIETVKSVVQHCLQKNIHILSLFAFSSENWSRPEGEVDFLMQLFIHALREEIKQLHEYGVCLRFIGERRQLSADLQTQMHSAEALTCKNERLILNVAVNYSGKWDILQAAKKMAAELQQGVIRLEDMDEEVFTRQLSTHKLPEPDLFIRTSGEQRISNFFLWQLAYTELYFCEVHWPDFTLEEFEKALQSYSLRERRYGQTSKQLTEKNHV